MAVDIFKHEEVQKLYRELAELLRLVAFALNEGFPPTQDRRKVLYEDRMDAVRALEGELD